MGVPMDVRAQFAELTTPHLAAAYNLAFWITRSRADAEDVVQDAYLRAWRGFGGFRGGPMLPWLLAIVRNAAYRWMSTHRHAGNVVSLDTLFLGDDGTPDPAMQIAADAPTAEAAMIAASENAHVMRALASLPPVLREILVLREIEGMSYHEIALTTGSPAGTVMSRLSRARLALRRALTGAGEKDSQHAM